MLTPKFSLSQNDSELIITIYARMARISDTEIHIDENTFIFYSSPYYLRLNLPGKLIDSENEVHKVAFDADDGAFTITCIKQTSGEYFDGLDMLTNLLIPTGKSYVDKPLIEVVNEDAETESISEDSDIDNWSYEQNLPNDIVLEGYKYGFANAYSSIFNELQCELCEVVDIANPDSKSPAQRREERLSSEKQAFDEDHYLADMFDKEDNESYLSYKPSFYDITEASDYSSFESDTLLALPRKELLINGNIRRSCYFTLVDIVFSWCFNHRISLGDHCAESAWNIRKISASLTWLDVFQNLRDVVISTFRRGLVYPLVRNWDFLELVLKDTIQIFALGRCQVLKCLLEVHSFFVEYEPYYILNQLYIDDMCIWVQKLPEEKFFSISKSLKKVCLSKEDVGLELPELESAAMLVMKEEDTTAVVSEGDQIEDVNAIIASMNHLTVMDSNLTAPSDQPSCLSINHHKQIEKHLSCSDSDTSSSSTSSDSSSDTSSDSSSDSSSSLDSDDDEN